MALDCGLIIRKVYSDVRVLRAFRFWADKNGAKGQEFRFDDFTVLPQE